MFAVVNLDYNRCTCNYYIINSLLLSGYPYVKLCQFFAMVSLPYGKGNNNKKKVIMINAVKQIPHYQKSFVI